MDVVLAHLTFDLTAVTLNLVWAISLKQSLAGFLNVMPICHGITHDGWKHELNIFQLDMRLCRVSDQRKCFTSVFYPSQVMQ